MASQNGQVTTATSTPTSVDTRHEGGNPVHSAQFQVAEFCGGGVWRVTVLTTRNAPPMWLLAPSRERGALRECSSPLPRSSAATLLPSPHAGCAQPLAFPLARATPHPEPLPRGQRVVQHSARTTRPAEFPRGREPVHVTLAR
jgi:hypothetical protein